MRAPWWLRRVISTRVRDRQVVFEFTVEDRFTDAMVKVAQAVADLGMAGHVSAERARGLKHVEALVDAMGHGFGIDPRVWQSDRRENRAERMRAERRAWWAERQAPSHPEYVGRRA